MKITNDTLCNIIEDKSTIVFQTLAKRCLDIDKKENKSWGEDFLNKGLIHSLTENSTRKIVLSSPVQKNINDCKIDVNKDFRFDVLRSLPNRCDTIQVEDRVCFKYRKTPYSIFCLFYRSPNGKDIEVSEFFVSLIDEEKHQYITSSWGVHERDLDLFLRTVTFLELTDVTLKVIKPNMKSGLITKGNNIKNNSASNIIQANSNWNIETIRIGTINVRGHWRLQPYGSVDNRYYKYIFIEPFKKGHTHRMSQKELVEHKLKKAS